MCLNSLVILQAKISILKSAQLPPFSSVMAPHYPHSVKYRDRLPTSLLSAKSDRIQEIESKTWVSSGGGQSSLGYLFGDGNAPKPTSEKVKAESSVGSKEPSSKPDAGRHPVDITNQVPAGIHSSTANNYVRADGQNTCNFITDRPSTKVHAAPGGGSSLGYLFGGGSK